MPQITTNAIVVRRADYRDNDRMITLFSPTMGRIDALCRGCRRQKSPLMAASELFCAGEYVLYQTSERATVVSCQVSDTYYALRSDYEKLSHGMYMLELCAAAIQPAQENERLFMLLLRSLAHLCYGDVEARRVTAVFVMGLSSLLGFRPQVGRCARCSTPVLQNRVGDEVIIGSFSPEHGGVLCPGCSAGEKCRIRERDAVYLQDIMKRGLKSLEDEHECPQALFDAMRMLAEGRLDTPIRSGRMLV
ncbi:MAG: DNA repair protein RecO [Clostridia bacterium]|nr:DNA repair protein RecO [Clostridia bacterium]